MIWLIIREDTGWFFKKAKGEPLTLHIRVHYWLSGAIRATVNGETKGDCIEIDLPMNLHPYQARDDPKKSVIMYGPVVLAGALGRINFPETDILDDHLALNNHPLIDVPVLVADEQMEEWIKRTDDTSLVFQTEPIGQPNHAEITLVPFYELHHQRYSIYWYLMNEEEYLYFKDEEKEKHTEEMNPREKDCL
ncbi:DUF4986 domain-containing protein [Bacillus atrophaeus]|uniref:DUF4986 domain-containing protein n=1 Tax=Bacillus atrophaeus TaxID=1452 RepID=UPI002E1C342E|nr:DUF4986 domain-containing protein [Bacillus atrophaeus]MED4815035.1 DUF4986 domain-containing protein [Bacillus atrophaeus]MED4824495.1 DUF4986 domain-containing protein [Bacillus atrophaeus]MED4843345.1 DUF4986 domain-containing protein [Bacillus atrophaeus]MED4858392.1 DUF4986 domain-containing protein [Bacillus atrophaeus]